ncbi:hypothetical protein A11A3_08210 [Alcanivorax hongdengensis A-11-3]|uniref:Uncharacterized protein n=1 Tax=Alcanivorax hongdengensis A-11-3 TaxID=1177179 RepID=L0WFJ9_9GAMM|nr:hypothetical protein [Alcanivorax hongdengensis]EKF74595.1 hypothetical protein A11A3_08210 [Alcanivorax hongdengensis A-11-3]
MPAASRRLSLLWFSVLSAPMLIGLAIAGLIHFGHYQAVSQVLPTETLRTGAIGAMALMLVSAGSLRGVILNPQALVSRGLAGKPAPATPDAQQACAVQLVQTGMFLLLGVLDTVAMAVIAFSLLQGDLLLALINGVYSLLLAVMAKPDFGALIEATNRQLRRG